MKKILGILLLILCLSTYAETTANTDVYEVNNKQTDQSTNKINNLSTIQQAEQVLNQGLSEKNPVKRKEAVIALSLEGARDTVFDFLKSALADDDVPVRIAACASLSELKDKRAIPLLEKALDDNAPEVSFTATQILWQMNQPIGRDILMEILAGERKTNSSYLVQQKRDAMRTMKNPGGLFKVIVKQGIGFVPVPGLGMGISSMEAIFKDSSVSGRALAALLLTEDKQPDSLLLLRESLADNDWTVRAAAIHALALRNHPEVRDDLVPLLEDKKEAVRYRAAAAYLRLDQLAKESQNSLKSTIKASAKPTKKR